MIKINYNTAILPMPILSAWHSHYKFTPLNNNKIHVYKQHILY